MNFFLGKDWRWCKCWGKCGRSASTDKKVISCQNSPIVFILYNCVKICLFQFSSNRCAHRPLFHGKVWDEEELVDSSGNPYAHNDNEDNEDNDNKDNDNEDWFKWEPLCASYGEQLRILQRVVILPVLKFKCFVIWFKLKKNSFKNKKNWNGLLGEIKVKNSANISMSIANEVSWISNLNTSGIAREWDLYWELTSSIVKLKVDAFKFWIRNLRTVTN